MTRFSFYPVANSYLLVGVAALVLLGLLVLRERVAGRRRAVLVALRIGVIVLIILAMLRPTLIYTEVSRQSATLIVLVDASRSMSVPDAVGGRTRWESLTRSLAAAEPALAELAEDFELKVYAFDSKAHALEVRDGQIALPEAPEGKETAIGFALEEALRREAGKRLLGVILLSDGAQRAYAPRDLPPQTAAARLKHLGYPLFTVPLGQARGLGEAKDIAVKQLLVNPSVFVKNRLAVSGQVRVDGFVNREIRLRLLFETSPDTMEPVAEQTLSATADGQLLPIQLSYAPQLPGEYRLTLEAVGRPGELVTTNNRLSTFVNVLSGGLSVLYLEGDYRREIGAIRRALDASPDINVDYVRIDPRRKETRPGDLAERFRPGKYDVYLLGDLDATAFDGDELKNLAEATNRGAGLMMLGGFHSFGPGGYAATPLADVLPVTMHRFDRQPLDGPIRGDLHHAGPLRMRPTPFGLLHFTLMLAGSREENLAVWSRLPPLEGANKFKADRIKPGALVLASAASHVPLLVAGNYGGGRVMAFAGDTTWRWSMRGFDTVHKRFWRQLILWLARKDQAAEGAVWVRLPKRRFAPSQRVEFTVGARSATGEPISDATYKAHVVLPDRTRRDLRLTQEEEQTAGSLRDTQAAGDYTLEVTAARDGEPLGSARARFLVFEQDLELDNAAADTSALENLAAITGGESLAAEQLDDLVERLATQTEHLEVERETKRTFYDTWPLLWAVVGLLGVEWFLRKRWGLV